MTRLRIVLVLGVFVVAAVGSVATAWVVNTEAPGALQNVLAVQAGTLLALAVTVFALLAPTVARLDDLIEALRAFARGERHTRVHPVDFAGLADVARAVNDVGASLRENDDPNLGPVQRKVRAAPPRPPSEEPRPSLHQPERAVPARPTTPVRRPVISDGDVVGEVRTRQRVKDGAGSGSGSPPTKPSPSPPPLAEAAPSREPPVVPPPADVPAIAVAPSSVPSVASTTTPTEAPRSTGESDGASDSRVTRKNRKKAKRAAAWAAKSGIPQSAIEADELDESTDPASASSGASDEGESGPAVDGAVGGVVSASTPDHIDKASAIMASTRPPVSADGPPTVIEPAPAAMPSRDELQRLFDEFRREKRAAGQGDSIDVDFDAFAETIVAESERLVLEHRCRGVRFEVAVADGEVSLRPRLLR